MTSTDKEDKESTIPSSADALSSSRSSKRNNKERDSSKAKEKNRRARDHPATTPGAVSSTSNRTERKKESSSGGKRSSRASVNKSPGGRKSRSSSSSATRKPGAVPSAGRDRSGKGSSRSSKSSHRTSKASSGSSTSRSSSRPSEEKHNLMTASPNVTPSTNEMEAGLVAEAVDHDTPEMQTTTNALRDKNREVEALRQELQRTREEQASQSRRRGKPFWGKVCLGSLILIGAIIGAVIAFSGGGDEAAATPAIVNPTDPSSEPTTQATTTGPDDQTVFDPPSSGTCSKISEGLAVDGQDKMSIQPLTIKMTVNLLVDIRSELWLPDMLQKVQQLVMPPIVGCGNTTLDVFTIGNAQVDQNNATLIACEDQTNGPCYTVEFPVNLFMKQDVVSYDLKELNQRVEGMFQINTSLMVDSENENSKAIKDIGSVTSSVPVTPSPSQQPSTTLILTSPPSPLPSLEPTMALTSGATASPTTLLSTPSPTASPTTLSTPGPTVTPVSGPTLAPTLVPSRGPTMFPTAGPTLAPVPGLTPPPSPLPTPGPTAAPSPPPTPGPTMTPTPGPSDSPSRAPSPIPSRQPSAAPTSKCTRLEAILSRFAPFDGNKAQALEWLCTDDTWEPPSSATDETSQSLLEERFALAVFYYATNGPGWSNNNGWLTSTGVCSWTGITVCNGDGSVTKFELSNGLPGYGFTGDFPDEMRALSNLEHIYFSYGTLSGVIPSFLTALTKLTYLHLGSTGRTGSIPSELWTMTKLQDLILWGNYITGTIPSGISSLTELSVFQVNWNDLSGSLPEELESMTRLTSLGVSENYLDGTIPPFAPSLTYCTLALEVGGSRHYQNRKTEGNCFTDTTNALNHCILSDNQCQLEATLSRFAPFDGNKAQALDWLRSDTWEPPSSATDEISQSLWAERFALAVFYYATNGDGWTANKGGWLTAASVCSWTGINGCDGNGSVTKFELGASGAYAISTGMVGDFPDEMRALSNLEHIDFGYNRYLSGTIPSFLLTLTQLTTLDIADTGRTGSIPSELWNLTKLREVVLYGNYLAGTIPSGISAMTDLRSFRVAFNDLSGSVPDEFVTQLTNLDLHENYFNGAVPSLPSSLTTCYLAIEGGHNSIDFMTKKTEGNCFTDTTNAPSGCNLSRNCPL